MALVGIPRDSTFDVSIEINVPAFRLEVRERGIVTAAYRIAVGMKALPTPIGDYQMDYLVWNPAWVPPDRSWARHDRPQPPGATNAMGRVKLHVLDLVFIHGSPLERSLGTAVLHACIRMRNADATALARTVLRHASGVLPAEIDSLERAPGRTRRIPLDQTAPVHIVYRLVELRGDSLMVYRDIYARLHEGDVLRDATIALRNAGVDSAQTDRARLRSIVRESRRRTIAVTVESLRGHSVATDERINEDTRPQ